MRELVEEDRREEHERRGERDDEARRERPVGMPGREERREAPGDEHEDEEPARVDAKLDSEQAVRCGIRCPWPAWRMTCAMRSSSTAREVDGGACASQSGAVSSDRHPVLARDGASRGVKIRTRSRPRSTPADLISSRCVVPLRGTRAALLVRSRAGINAGLLLSLVERTDVDDEPNRAAGLSGRRALLR